MVRITIENRDNGKIERFDTENYVLAYLSTEGYDNLLVDCQEVAFASYFADLIKHDVYKALLKEDIKDILSEIMEENRG